MLIPDLDKESPELVSSYRENHYRGIGQGVTIRVKRNFEEMSGDAARKLKSLRPGLNTELGIFIDRRKGGLSDSDL